MQSMLCDKIFAKIAYGDKVSDELFYKPYIKESNDSIMLKLKIMNYSMCTRR